MGAGKTLTLPTHKALMASLEETAPYLMAVTEASSGRSPGRLRIPTGIATAIKSFPKLMTWIGKNRVAYEKFVAASVTNETPKTKARTKGATG